MPNSTDSLGSQQLKETRFLSLLNEPVINIWKNSNVLEIRYIHTTIQVSLQPLNMHFIMNPLIYGTNATQ